MPFLWAGLLYGGCGGHGARFFWNKPVGPADILLLVVAFCPPQFLGVVTSLALAVLFYKRHGSILETACCAAAGGVQIVDGFYDPALSPLIAVLLNLLFGMLLSPRMGAAHFFSGLPVVCMLSLPKWIADDWLWRISIEWGCIRKCLSLVVPVARLPWKSNLKFDAEQALVDWGDSERYPRVRLDMRQQGLVATIGFWEDVVPAIKQRAPLAVPASVNLPSMVSVAPKLLSLIECAGGSPDALASLDSLQAITLAESVRRELGAVVSVADVLRCADAHELSTILQASRSEVSCPKPSGGEPDGAGAHRVFVMNFPRSPVDWCIRFGGPGHLDMAAFQRALDRLIQRHSALRTVESPDEAMREIMNIAAAIWQLWCTCVGRLAALFAPLAGGCLFACWPRTVQQSSSKARIVPKVPLASRLQEDSFKDQEDEEYVFVALREMNRDSLSSAITVRYPFDVSIVPVYRDAPEVPAGTSSAEVASMLPAANVTWYIYLSITHAYSDGASGQAVMTDLLKLYAEESELQPKKLDDEIPVEHLELLQRRLRRSLRGRLPGDDADPNDDVYHEIVCEDWGKRPGYTMRLYFREAVFSALRSAAADVIGCGVDVAWLAASVVSLFRLFPKTPCVRLVLKCACRDGPSEGQMVGFLSEQRVFPVHMAGPSMTVLDVVGEIMRVRQARSWRVPAPFEAGLCVYVNVVSQMTRGSLPLDCEHVVRENSPPPNGSWSAPAYSHLNLRLDQLSALAWDYRVFHWDEAWGWDWGTYFASVLGSAIADLVASPLSSVLSQDAAAVCNASSKRKTSKDVIYEGEATEPPWKAPRCDVPDAQ